VVTGGGVNGGEPAALGNGANVTTGDTPGVTSVNGATLAAGADAALPHATRSGAVTVRLKTNCVRNAMYKRW
jgi:hypothetical protein